MADRLSQEVVEVGLAGESDAHVSQLVVEVGSLVSPTNAAVSQFVVEVGIQVQHDLNLGFISSTTTTYGISLEQILGVPFIGSATVVYELQLPKVDVPFIGSATVVYDLLLPKIDVPFIGSHTNVYGLFSIYSDGIFSGRGNGGEMFAIELAPNGTSVTATLAEDISGSGALLLLDGDSGLPTSFIVQIDDEFLYVTRQTPGAYRVRARGLSNTLAADHEAGTDAVWDDSYDMAVAIADRAETHYNDGTNDFIGWLIGFDSTQAYVGASRYPFHVTELVGVFEAGDGIVGNKLDASQPNAVCVPGGTSDNCPAAMTVPARIAVDVEVGDTAVFRFTNPEASVLRVGSRSVAAQTWYGFKRVNDDDTLDVTLTDTDGNIVDGTAEATWLNPTDRFTSTTLPGDDRTFTYGPPRFSEKGWPIAALAVRHGRRRVPYWQSPTWHNFSYVYSGFDTDATYVQVLINRNGFDPSDPLPAVDLPGPQDIDGPEATWDDGTYYFGTAWYVGIAAQTAIFVGPTLNLPPGSPGTGGGGVGGTGPGGGGAGNVSFPPSGPPVVVDDDLPEGGSGGGIGGTTVGGGFRPFIYRRTTIN